jgi:hypothetical protein
VAWPTTTPIGGAADVDGVAGEEGLPRAGSHVEPHERLTRVDPDAHLRGVAGDGWQSLHLGDESQAGPHRTLGVVLVNHRHAEDGDDGVADELLHRAAVALHDLAGEGVVATEQGVDVLGIRVRAHRRRSDEVAEERRDDLALLDDRRGRGQGRAALQAEARAVRQVRAAGRADHRGPPAIACADIIRQPFGSRDQGLPLGPRPVSSRPLAREVKGVTLAYRVSAPLSASASVTGAVQENPWQT